MPETIPQCNSTQDQLSLTHISNLPVLASNVFYFAGISKDNTRRIFDFDFEQRKAELLSSLFSTISPFHSPEDQTVY